MALVNKIKMAREVMECLAGGAPFPINDMTKSMMKLGFGDVAPAIFALFPLTLDDGIAIMSAHI